MILCQYHFTKRFEKILDFCFPDENNAHPRSRRTLVRTLHMNVGLSDAIRVPDEVPGNRESSR